jgi:hypothetical protein
MLIINQTLFQSVSVCSYDCEARANIPRVTKQNDDIIVSSGKGGNDEGYVPISEVEATSQICEAVNTIRS